MPSAFVQPPGRRPTAKGEKLTGFAIRGRGQEVVGADAQVQGKGVVVSSPQVPHPVVVRYAWHINPPAALTSKAASPLRPSAPTQLAGHHGEQQVDDLIVEEFVAG